MKLIFFFFLLPLGVLAQFVAPAASPRANTITTAGYTQLEVDYHRPNVRGRTIFGGLIPWGEIWRAGANENTLLKLDGVVRIGETRIEPGAYSLFLIPEEKGGWTWVVNSQTDGWGTRGYDEGLDEVRQQARARRLPQRVETLEYRWMNVTPQSVELVLEWEWYRLALTIKLPTDKQVDDQATLHLNPAKDPNEYYAAARYYLDNGRLRKAKAWIDRWDDAAPEQFGRMRYQALIEYKLGNVVRARRLMNRSLELAVAANNSHYVRMNAQSLKEWTVEQVEISADSVIARSIRYHDPEGEWEVRSHRIQLAESRPDGTVRQTQLTLYPGSDEFDMRQTRGRDKIQLRYLNNSFAFSHNGSAEIDESTAQRLGLTPKAMLNMRDYYTFLYGLPMKLTDDGAQIRPDVTKVWFHGKELLRIEVAFQPDAGGDIWQLYFHPKSYRLSGYSFYHAADGPGTGEYILLEGEAKVGAMKLPAKRHWYLTEEQMYLGTDEIVN